MSVFGVIRDAVTGLTAQQLGQALFGAVDLMANIPTELADLIGSVRA